MSTKELALETIKELPEDASWQQIEERIHFLAAIESAGDEVARGETVPHSEVRKKLDLVDEIWKSVAPEAHSLEVTEEEKQILDERWSSFLAFPESALTPDQFNDQLRRLRA
ncbi:MAG: addiction module protein [Luteolibacter sp.]